MVKDGIGTLTLKDALQPSRSVESIMRAARKKKIGKGKMEDAAIL